MNKPFAKIFAPIANAHARVVEALNAPHVWTLDETETRVIPGTDETFTIRRIIY